MQIQPGFLNIARGYQDKSNKLKSTPEFKSGLALHCCFVPWQRRVFVKYTTNINF